MGAGIHNPRLPATRTERRAAPAPHPRVPLVPSPAGQQGYWSVALDAVALSGGAWAQPETVLCGALPAGAAAGAAGAAAIRVASNGGASGCVGALDSGTSLLTSTPHQVGHLNRRLGFRPGPPPLPGGTAACGGEVDRLMAVIIQAGGEDPGSSQLSSICQGMGSGPLSPQATLCALVLANIDAARGALQGGRGFPTQQTLAAARNASVEDCGLLPYRWAAVGASGGRWGVGARGRRRRRPSPAKSRHGQGGVWKATPDGAASGGAGARPRGRRARSRRARARVRPRARRAADAPPAAPAPRAASTPRSTAPRCRGCPTSAL